MNIQEKWTIVKRKGKYRVYKKGANGRPVGKARGVHDTLSGARAQQRALYVRAPEQSEATMNWELVTEQAGENKGYVYLKINWAWEIERLYSALNTIFGYDENWQWNDPSTLHVTLAYAENVSDEQLLETVKAIVGHNAFDLKIVGVGSFDNPDAEQKAIYLSVEKSDELGELQKAVYDSLNRQEVGLSEFSDPDSWTPHITMAYAPVDSAVPEFTSEMLLMSNKVCVGRSDYDTLAEIPLKWSMPERYAEDGMGPVMEQTAANWKIGIGRDLTVGKDSEWDGNAAAASVFEAAAFDSEDPNLTLTRRAFLIYNSAAPKLKSSYKLPIASWTGDKLVVVAEALTNATSRLPQLEGLSETLLDRAERALNSYKKKAGIDQPEATAVVEQGKTPIRLTFISEMRGNPPKIDLPSDIDLNELKEQYQKIFGDEDLEFVTLPIGMVNAESRNGRTYPKTAVDDLVKQVNELRPEGMWGHLTDEEMATRYDPPAIRWLAALIDKEGIAWGKHLPLTEQSRDYYRMARATRAKVATSITAMAEMNENVVEHLDLYTIDIADPKRVGILQTVAMPLLTQEMKATGRNVISLDNHHDVIIRVRELTNEKPVETHKEKPMLTDDQIQELINERDALKITTSEQETALKELTERESVNATTISELLEEAIVNEVREQVSIEAAHDLIIEMVKQSKPQNRHAVKESVAKVLDKESIKKMLKQTVTREMGPVQPVPTQRNGKYQSPEEKWLEPIQEDD